MSDRLADPRYPETAVTTWSVRPLSPAQAEALRQGPRWSRPNALRVPANAPPLVKVLYRLIRRERATIAWLAERSGVGAKTIGHWKTEHAPVLPLLEACLAAFGYRLVAVPEEWLMPGQRSVEGVASLAAMLERARAAEEATR